MIRMYDAIGSYQGVVMNLNKAWLAESANQSRLKDFVNGFYQRVNEMKNNPDQTITQLSTYYNIAAAEANSTYNSLWESGGLSLQPQFNLQQLAGNESIFHSDTGITIPTERSWVVEYSGQ